MKAVYTCTLAVTFFGLVATATADYTQSPQSIAGSTVVNATQAKQLFDKGVAFIDVRKNSDWEAGRVPGAIHLELKKILTEQSLGQEVDKDEEVVFYCNGHKCLRSSNATTKAVSWGYSKVYYFRDGLPGWKAEGYSVE